MMTFDSDQGRNGGAVVQVGKRPGSGMDNRWVLITKVRDGEGNTLAKVGPLCHGLSRSQLGENVQHPCPVLRRCGATIGRRQLEYFIRVALSKRANRIPGLFVVFVALE
jgi:hypothetical protein